MSSLFDPAQIVPSIPHKKYSRTQRGRWNSMATACHGLLVAGPHCLKFLFGFLVKHGSKTDQNVCRFDSRTIFGRLSSTILIRMHCPGQLSISYIQILHADRWALTQTQTRKSAERLRDLQIRTLHNFRRMPTERLRKLENSPVFNQSIIPTRPFQCSPHPSWTWKDHGNVSSPSPSKVVTSSVDGNRYKTTTQQLDMKAQEETRSLQLSLTITKALLDLEEPGF